MGFSSQAEAGGLREDQSQVGVDLYGLRRSWEGLLLWEWAPRLMNGRGEADRVTQQLVK